LYQAVMETNPSIYSSNPFGNEIQGKRPVDMISWYDAIVFCNMLSVREGLTPAYEMQTAANASIWSTGTTTWGPVPASNNNSRWDAVRIVDGSTGYRLPTEAQWEYACRAGSTTYWYFGNNESDLLNYAWYRNNSGNMTHQVGLKIPNNFGLYDMHGNVTEWCWDWLQIYPNTAETNPTGPSSSDIDDIRIFRGGSHGSYAEDSRSAFRAYLCFPYEKGNFTGFRIVRPRDFSVPEHTNIAINVTYNFENGEASLNVPPTAISLSSLEIGGIVSITLSGASITPGSVTWYIGSFIIPTDVLILNSAHLSAMVSGEIPISVHFSINGAISNPYSYSVYIRVIE